MVAVCATDTVPRGVYLRVAAKPWGPWSTPVAVMMVSGTENPYCNYMHLPTDVGSCPTGARNPFEDEAGVSKASLAPAAEMPAANTRRSSAGPSNYHKYSANGTNSALFHAFNLEPIPNCSHGDRCRSAFGFALYYTRRRVAEIGLLIALCDVLGHDLQQQLHVETRHSGVQNSTPLEQQFLPGNAGGFERPKPLLSPG